MSGSAKLELITGPLWSLVPGAGAAAAPLPTAPDPRARATVAAAMTAPVTLVRPRARNEDIGSTSRRHLDDIPTALTSDDSSSTATTRDQSGSRLITSAPKARPGQ